MSSGELRRVEVLARVKSEELKLVDAAAMLRISYRQVKRLWKRYRKQGAAGLKHGNAGRASNRSKPKRFRRRVLQLVRKKYSGQAGERFGPTLAAEHLASDEGVEVHPETLRRWMLAEGLWSRTRKKRQHRKRRERKEHFGELVQLDGSFHAWFEKRGPTGCLMNLVDDATSTTLARIGNEETIWAAAGVLRAWIEAYGVPQALYTDWKNVYVREPTEKEMLRGEVPVTQFGRMCERLGIRIIAASSPEAKGRVERNHGTHQDRLVKKLRLKKIASYAAANQYMAQEYLPEHNRRFAIQPAAPEDYHAKAPRRTELEDVFRLEIERVIANDWVVRYDNRYFQVERNGRRYAPAKGKVTVCQWEDGRLEIRYRGAKIAYTEIAAPPARAPRQVVEGARRAPARRAQAAPDHPWKQGYRNMRPRRAEAARPGVLRVSAFASP